MILLSSMANIEEIVKAAKKKGYSQEDIQSNLLRKGYSKKDIDYAFHPPRKKQLSEKQLNFSEILKGLLSNPKNIFESFHEKSIKNALIAFVSFAAIFTILQLIIGFGLQGSQFDLGFPSFGLGLFSNGIVFGISIALTFAYAGISHLVILGYKGSGDFTDTYNVCTYSLLPALIFFIIPLIGWLAIIYSVVLMTYGLSHYHNISKGKAIFAALLPLIIPIVLLILFVILLIISLRGIF